MDNLLLIINKLVSAASFKSSAQAFQAFLAVYTRTTCLSSSWLNFLLEWHIRPILRVYLNILVSTDDQKEFSKLHVRVRHDVHWNRETVNPVYPGGILVVVIHHMNSCHWLRNIGFFLKQSVTELVLDQFTDVKLISLINENNHSLFQNYPKYENIYSWSRTVNIDHRLNAMLTFNFSHEFAPPG